MTKIKIEKCHWHESVRVTNPPLVSKDHFLVDREERQCELGIMCLAFFKYCFARFFLYIIFIFLLQELASRVAAAADPEFELTHQPPTTSISSTSRNITTSQRTPIQAWNLILILV